MNSSVGTFQSAFPLCPLRRRSRQRPLAPHPATYQLETLESRLLLDGSTGVNFASAIDVATSGAPKIMTAGDLNGDGKADIVVASSSGIVVLLHNDNGTFNSTFYLAQGVSDVVIGDINGDGKPDLTMTLGRSVIVYQNNGVGGFAFGGEFDFDSFSSLNALAIGDFNGDGKTDVAVADSATSTIHVLFNTGGTGLGMFGSRADYGTGQNPQSIVSGDFNGDGKPDLALISSSAQTVSVLLNTGNGTFAPKVDYSTGSSPDSILSADLNGDGRQDLIVTKGVSNSIGVLMSASNGTFAPMTDYVVNDLSFATIADFNGDGKPDLAVVSNAGKTVSVALNTGDGAFGPSNDYALNNNPSLVSSGDFNGDGHVDLAFADYYDGTISQMLNLGTADNAPTNIALANNSILDQQTAGALVGALNTTDPDACIDYIYTLVDGAGSDDNSLFAVSGNNLVTSAVLHYTTKSTYTVRVRSTDIGGLYLEESFTISLVPANFGPKIDFNSDGEPLSVTSADFNGDGLPDLAVANGWQNSLSVFMNTGNDTFASPVDYSTGALDWTVTSADFNGDGKPDLAVANHNDGTVSILLNAGNGAFAPKVDYPAGSDPQSIISADLNGDGLPDLVVTSFGAAKSMVTVLLNKGNGVFAIGSQLITGSLFQSSSAVTIADFDGDGKPDLAVANGSGVSVFLNTGNGTFASAVSYATGSAPWSVTSADFNGDGKPDLAVSNLGGATVSVLLNNGNGTFAPAVNYTTGQNPASVTTGDFNGDGWPDLAVANVDSASVSVFLNNGDGTFGAKSDYFIGGEPMSVTTVDIDDDGKPDLAVANPYGGLSVLPNLTPAMALRGNGPSDPFQLRLDSANPAVVQIFHNTPLTGQPTFSSDLSSLNTLTLADGTYTLLSDLDALNLTLQTGATAVFSQPVTDVGALTFAGGQLDLQGHDLVVTTGGLSVLGAQIAAGLLYDSTATAGRGVGLLTGGQYAALTGRLTFDGRSINPTNLLIKSTYLGDTNFDGIINADDYLQLDEGYLFQKSGWFYGDFNYDNKIDYQDYAAIDTAFKNQSGNSAAQATINQHAAEFGAAYTAAMIPTQAPPFPAISPLAPAEPAAIPPLIVASIQPVNQIAQLVLTPQKTLAPQPFYPPTVPTPNPAFPIIAPAELLLSPTAALPALQREV